MSEKQPKAPTTPRPSGTSRHYFVYDYCDLATAQGNFGCFLGDKKSKFYEMIKRYGQIQIHVYKIEDQRVYVQELDSTMKQGLVNIIDHPNTRVKVFKNTAYVFDEATTEVHNINKAGHVFGSRYDILMPYLRMNGDDVLLFSLTMSTNRRVYKDGTRKVYFILANIGDAPLFNTDDFNHNIAEFMLFAQTMLTDLLKPLHANNILHGDFKIDNTLHYQKAYTLIDYGLLCDLNDVKAEHPDPITFLEKMRLDLQRRGSFKHPFFYISRPFMNMLSFDDFVAACSEERTRRQEEVLRVALRDEPGDWFIAYTAYANAFTFWKTRSVTHTLTMEDAMNMCKKHDDYALAIEIHEFLVKLTEGFSGHFSINYHPKDTLQRRTVYDTSYDAYSTYIVEVVASNMTSRMEKRSELLVKTLVDMLNSLLTLDNIHEKLGGRGRRRIKGNR